jgi:hypothetical protein
VTVPAVPPQAKVDFRRTPDGYHAKLGEYRSLVVPPRQYLMVDGHGDPSQSTSFGEAVSALYPVAYAMTFTSKQERGRDYVVPPGWKPFDDEAEVLRRMHEEVIPEKGLVMTGRHHEIYLSDRRRVPRHA